MRSWGQGITRTLCFIVFSCFLNQDLLSAQTSLCTVHTFKIAVIPTGRQVNSKAEWKVKIENMCVCTIQNLKLFSPDFNPLVKIDPSIISKFDDTHWIVPVVFEDETFSFTYVGDRADFTPVDFGVACS